MRRTAIVAVAVFVMMQAVPAAGGVSTRVRISGASPYADCTADDLAAQGSDVFVGSEVEPYVTVDPNDTNHIVATWQQDRFGDGGSRGTMVAVSFDRGLTWAQRERPNLTLCTGGAWQRASDPWVDIAEDATVYQMSLVINNAPPLPYRSGMSVSRSLDGGLTWSDPVLVADDSDPSILHDKNSLTVDPLDAAYAYAVWDVGTGSSQPAQFARTTNGGTTWEPTRTIYTPGNGTFTVSHQIVTPIVDGVPVLLDFFVETGSGFPKIRFIRSDDRGATWTGATRVAATRSIGFVVTPATAETVRAFGGILFDVAIDPATNRIYLVWQDARKNGEQWDDIVMSSSGDLGETWSAPIRISRTPETTDPTMNQSFVPSIAVADDGTLAVTYFDFRLDGPGVSGRTDYWTVMCRPRSGGDCTRPNRWNRELRLTDTSFDITLAPSAGGFFIGDYMGLDAVGRKGFITVYTRPHSGDTGLGVRPPVQPQRRHAGDALIPSARRRPVHSPW